MEYRIWIKFAGGSWLIFETMADRAEAFARALEHVPMPAVTGIRVTGYDTLLRRQTCDELVKGEKAA